MSDDSSAQTSPPDTRPAAATPAPVTPVKPRKFSGPGVLFPLLTLVSLAASAGVGYLYLQQSAQMTNLQATVAGLQSERGTGSDELAGLQETQRRLQDTQQQLQDAQQQIEMSLREDLRQALQESLAQELDDIEQQLASANSRLQAQTTQLEAMGRELVSTNRRIRDTSGDTEQQDWLLAEAESLLRLAQQYLLIAQDVRTAIGLFNAADERLRSSSNPAVFSVREVLARELATLQALPAPDVQGLYAQLGTQIEQVDLLAVDSGDGEGFSVPTREAAVTEGWFAGAMDALGQYFVVTKRDQAVTPLVTAEQEYLIRRSVQLQIEQAQLALLQGKADIYRDALDAAVTAISTRLRDQDGKRAALIAALTRLRDAPVTVTIPPVNNTLEALQQVQTSTPAATPTAPATPTTTPPVTEAEANQ